MQLTNLYLKTMETVKFKTTPLNSTERKVNDEDISAKKEIKEAEKKNGRTWWTFKHPMFCPFHVLLKKRLLKKDFV